MNKIDTSILVMSTQEWCNYSFQFLTLQFFTIIIKQFFHIKTNFIYHYISILNPQLKVYLGIQVEIDQIFLWDQVLW